MKVRADVAELIRKGHTNASIAQRLHLHCSTVAEARRALRYPPADALGRLYAEEAPTGRVRDYKPASGRMPTSPAQQRENRERLLAALREDAT